MHAEVQLRRNDIVETSQDFEYVVQQEMQARETFQGRKEEIKYRLYLVEAKTSGDVFDLRTLAASTGLTVEYLTMGNVLPYSVPCLHSRPVRRYV